MRDRHRLIGELPVAPALRGTTDHLQRGRDGNRYIATLFPVGDLDGDGGGDVVDARYRLEHDPDTGLVSEHARFEVRNGRTGTLLWTADPGPHYVSFPLFATVGPDHRPGLLVVAYDEAAASPSDVTVAAYAGTGWPLWTRSFPGGAYGSGLSATVDGLLAKPAGGQDVLVTSRVNAAADLAADGARGASTQVMVLDGRTGDVRPLGDPILDASFLARALPVGDLDGDKRGDVVVGAPEDGRGSLTALRSTDGARLWTSPELTRNHGWHVTAAPDVTGNGVADVLVAAYPMVPPGEPAPEPTVTVVEGRSGRVAWVRAGLRPVVLGDIDGRPGAELAVHTPAAGGGRVAVTATAYDSGGRARWRVTRAVVTHPDHSYNEEQHVGSAGDIDGDRVTDLGYAVTAGPPGQPEERRDEGVVNGRTGSVRRDAVPRMVASVLPLDGHGADAYTAATEPHLVVAAYGGNGPQRLWRVAILDYGVVWRSSAARLDADRCADILLMLHRDGGGQVDYAISGASGQPLWSIHRYEDRPAVLRRPSPVRLDRYRRTC